MFWCELVFIEAVVACDKSLRVYSYSCCIDTRKVYATVVDKHHHLVRKDGGEYSDEDFFAHPEEYKATFYEKVNWNWYKMIDVYPICYYVFVCVICFRL